MQEPVEIQVEEHVEIVERVAAIDVAKAAGMVCTRVPHDTRPGGRVTKVWEVKATTRAPNLWMVVVRALDQKPLILEHG